jgi:hypothetical protein
MTEQEYEKFTEVLQENGYKKYVSCLSNEDFYWCKGFKYQEDEDGDKRSSYQVLYLIWDMRKYKSISNNNHFGVQMRVLISENRRTDFIRSHAGSDDIKKNETIAQSFYEWAKKNLEL